MIPVTVKADLKVTLATDRIFTIKRNHPLYSVLCPACGKALGGPGNRKSVLVFVGIDPDLRKNSGFTLGGAVSVHAACAGVPEK